MAEGERPDVVHVVRSWGRPIPLLYVRDGDSTYVWVAHAAARWAEDASGSGRSVLEFEAGQRRSCLVRSVTAPDDRARLRQAFVSKYGLSAWERHFGEDAVLLRFHPLVPSAEGSAIERARGEFDAVAAEYLPRLSTRALDLYLKQVTRERLRSIFRGRDPLLEIGPGPGFETIPLLRDGHRTTAVDLSSGMLEQLGQRAREASVDQQLELRHGSLGSLPEALGAEDEGRFQGAYSTFGAFNLEPAVDHLGRDLGRFLRPGGLLTFTTLNRPGPVPMLWELLLGRPRSAFDRVRTRRAADGDRHVLDLYPRSIRDWDRWLAPEFRRRCARPVSVLAPPFALPRRVVGLREDARRILRRVDSGLSAHPALAEFGEWALLVYVRQ